MAKETKATTPAVKPEARQSLFSMFAEVDIATGGGDINNLEIKEGDNKFRILNRPILVRKHWDLPISSDLVVVPCRKAITDLRAYSTNPTEYLANAGKCEFCEYAEKHPGFYPIREHWIFNVAQNEKTVVDGKDVLTPVVKIADIAQRSILRAITKFEEDPDWLPLMPNGLQDIEINVKKVKTGPKATNIKYEVGGVPTSKPLAPEELERLRELARDLDVLKAPPAFDEKGDERWAEYMEKAKEPQEGEKSKALPKLK
jgi:hypothetical protein